MDPIDKLKQEWPVIRRAPLSFVIFLVVGFFLGYGAISWHLHGEMSEKDGELYRYRVVLGIEPGSPGALVELNNQELALRAESIVSKIRDLASAFETRVRELDQLKASGKIDMPQEIEQENQASKDISQSFDSNLASDAYNVDNELRKRLSPEAMSHVVRVPALVADNGSHIPLIALFRGTGVDTYYMRGLADEIEQMARLLPPD
jgi:hypothetical protein